jgi:photosystem II stability/assembly factor-like uncharacterized protein
LLRRQAAEHYFVKDNSMKYLFIIVVFLAALTAKAQIPVWQHTPVVPSAYIHYLNHSNTSTPLYYHLFTSRLNRWNEKNKKWDIDFDQFIDCRQVNSYPTFCQYGTYLIMINTCADLDYFSYDTTSLLYRDTIGLWHFLSFPDTLNQLHTQYGQNIKIFITGIFSGSDNHLYLVCGYERRDPLTTDVIAREFFIYSKNDIHTQWKRRKNLHPKFFWSSYKYYSHVHWENENQYILSDKDTVFIYDNGIVRNLPPLNYDGQLFFSYYDNNIYVVKGGLYRYSDSAWHKIFSQPVNKYLVINNQEIYCSTLGSRSWDYALGGMPFGDSLYKTTDGGKSWTFLCRYFHPILKADDGYLYGTYFSPRSRLARTNDEGKTIEFVEDGLGYTDQLFSIQAQQDGSILACGPGMWRSTDEGESWQSLGLDSFYVKHAIIDKKGYIHAAVGSDSFPQYRARGQVGVRSTDMGKTWELQFHYTWDNAGGFAQSPDGTLYTLFGRYYDTDFTMQSRDDGVTWQTIDRREMVKYKDNPKEYEVYLAGGLPAFLGDSIVILPKPLSRSTDGGRTWQFIRRPKTDSEYLYSCSSVLYDSFRKRFIAFASEGSYYSYTSIDSGKTWQELSENRFSLRNVQSIIDSTGRIYSYRGGIGWSIYSDDGGESWVKDRQNVAEGSPFYSPINTMTVSKRGYVYFADRQHGLFRTTERFPPVGVKEEEETPSTLRIMPNPANTFLSLSGTDNALVFIADMQGSLMYQGYEHSIDISRWQTGMYCARIPATGQKALFMVVR